MSNFDPQNPYGGQGSQPHLNPYMSPQAEGMSPIAAQQAVKGKVMAPAIALLVVGGLGLAASVFNVFYAFVATPPPVDPRAPEFVRSFQQGSVGIVAATMQVVFVVVNGIILAGGYQMLLFKNRMLAIVASVLAMVNIGTCCCFLGLPVGIWSVIILSSKDVIAVFDASA